MNKALTVIGNWKMYKTARQATDFMEELLPLIEGTKAAVYLAVPFTAIQSAAHYAKHSLICIGAQNMHDAKEGAFTGEIASLMFKEAGARFVLLGHSERRTFFSETDEMIHRKLIRALEDGLQPILCIGESLSHHEKGDMESFLKQQLFSALDHVPSKEAKNIMIAYEPIWAIGTGKIPTTAQIQKVHALIREELISLFGKSEGTKVPILYGGSVKPENVAEIVDQKDVDGVLVGGASLDPKIFSTILQNVDQTISSTKKRSTTNTTKKKDI